MTSPGDVERKLERFVLSLAAASGLATAVAYGILAQPFAGWTPEKLALGAGLMVAYFVLQRQGFLLQWRDHRTISTIDEPAVYVALVALPYPAVIAIVFVGTAFVQVVARRKPIKALFNVSAYSLGATVACIAFAACVAWGWPPVLAALPAVALYTVTSNALVASVFARVERQPFLPVFRERFALSTALHGPLGGSFGFAAVVLWSFHPLAVLMLVPLTLIIVSFARLNAASDRENRVRGRLASMAGELVGVGDEEQAARRILDACSEIFLAGRVKVALGSNPERSWSRDLEGGIVDDPIEAPIVGRDGARLGTLTLYNSYSAKNLVGRADLPLLKIVAAQAAAAVESVRATQAILELKNRHEEIVENVPAGVLRLDAVGTIVQTNPHLLDALHQREPATGRLVFEWAPLLAMPELLRRIEGMLRGEPFFDDEVTLESGVTLGVSGVPLRPSPGADPEGGIVLFADLTSRKQAEAAMRSQSLTRPFVRRLVLSLVAGLRVPPESIAEVGRTLARDVAQADAPAYAAAFREWGLGNLAFDGMEKNGNYRFVADDLLERRTRSSQPTCHLARGFLEGAIAQLHGASSLGSELRCQSQGHPRCEFVIQPRAAPAMPVKKAKAAPAGKELLTK